MSFRVPLKPVTCNRDPYIDLPPSKWSNVGTLRGYWLAPGAMPRVVSEVDLFRCSIQSLPEIRGRVRRSPFQCQILMNGLDELFFGEVWVIEFPHIPILPGGPASFRRAETTQRMHWRTFWRLTSQHDEFFYRSLAMWMRGFELAK